MDIKSTLRSEFSTFYDKYWHFPLLFTHFLSNFVVTNIYALFDIPLKNSNLQLLRGDFQKKRYFLGIFPKRGGGHPISQNFCKITKSFLACQIHPKVLKHVFHTGGTQSSTTCGAIDDRRISLKAIDERVFTKFRDKKCCTYKFVQQKCRIYPFSIDRPDFLSIENLVFR